MECREVKTADVGVGDEDVGRGWEGVEDGLCDVRDEMETAMNGLLPKDGDFADVDQGHLGVIHT